MASLLKKLLKNPRSPPPPPLRMLPYLGKPHAAADPSLPHHQEVPLLLPVNPDAGAEAAWRPPSLLSHQVYPSFPHCFVVDPILAGGGSIAEELYEGGDDGRETATVWADSVKKKRKRKMNKHKLRKLRRRLRRQT